MPMQRTSKFLTIISWEIDHLRASLPIFCALLQLSLCCQRRYEDPSNAIPVIYPQDTVVYALENTQQQADVGVICHVYKTPRWFMEDEVYWEKKFDNGEYVLLAASNMYSATSLFLADSSTFVIDVSGHVATHVQYKLLAPNGVLEWIYGEYRCGATTPLQNVTARNTARLFKARPRANCWQNWPTRLDDPDGYILFACQILHYVFKENTSVYWIPPSIFGGSIKVPSKRGDFSAFSEDDNVYLLAVMNLNSEKLRNVTYRFTVVESTDNTRATIVAVNLNMFTEIYDVYWPDGAGYFFGEPLSRARSFKAMSASIVLSCAATLLVLTGSD